MKPYEETIAAVLKRRDEYETEKKRRAAIAKRVLIPALCCIAFAAAAVGLRYALPKPIPTKLPARDANPATALSSETKNTFPDPAISGASAVRNESEPTAGSAVSPTATVPPTAGSSELTPESPAYSDANDPVPATVNIPATATVPASGVAPDGRVSTATVPAPATADVSSGAFPTSGEPASAAASSTAASSAHENASSTVAPPPDRTAPPDAGNYGDESGGMDVCIPVLPADRTIVETGERITEEEAAAYFAQNLGSLASALSASGVPADSLRVSEKGYSHVCYSGLAGERLEARVNFRDYLVYNGEELVAIVTLYKENGQLYATPAFGAAWFGTYSDFLKRHWREALVYVYAGSLEIILSPDGRVFSAVGAGGDASRYFEGVDDPYSLFFHPAAVYIP
ncbi:MAG: hypothetical protein IJL26_04785 [Clostridia bacterium]|nr:hypothetical protein [Clostridia bacterium]